MRRKEFSNDNREMMAELLSTTRIAHLAFLRSDALELLPYNFVLLEGYLYFHSSPETGLAGAVGGSIRCLVYDQVAWIPSTWRHPELACPATTYFRSLSFEATLEKVESVEEKAGALQAFMEKYQPDDAFKPLSDPAYHGPLNALFVARLKVENPVCKLKMGQHLTEKHRSKVYQNLRRRALPGDRIVAHAMSLANPGLDDSGWVENLTEGQVRSVVGLLRETYWASERTPAEQRRLNEQSQVLVAKCQGDRVLAFARVVLLNRKSAYLADVVVHPDFRGKGMGKALMRRLMEHPAIESVGRFMLATRTAQSFYHEFGFVEKFRTDTSFMFREPESLYV